MARLDKEAYEAQEKAKMATGANLAALKERQKREDRYSRFNSIKINNQWRKIMRMTSVDQLRAQIEIYSQSHERDVDRKDAVIQMLDRDLEDAEEQYEMAVRGHMRIVQKLLDLQYQKLKTHQEDFEASLGAIESECEAERQDIAAAHSKHRKDLTEIIHAMQTSFHEMESEMRQVPYVIPLPDNNNNNSNNNNMLGLCYRSLILLMHPAVASHHKVGQLGIRILMVIRLDKIRYVVFRPGCFNVCFIHPFAGTSLTNIYLFGNMCVRHGHKCFTVNCSHSLQFC